MSSSIPFVSSSPPPIEDGHSFGWDEDEEDDFGTFASAPGILTSGHSGPQDSKFDADSSHSQAGLSAICSGGKENCRRGVDTQDKETETFSVFEGNLHKRGCHANHRPELDEERGSETTVNNENTDDFTDFTAFQEDSSRESKPHIAKLPLQNMNLTGPDPSKECSDSEATALEPAVAKRQESAVVDSGVFSSDLSPVPISESVSSFGGDNTVQSEDESVFELPPDSRQESLSVVLPVTGSTTDSNLQSEGEWVRETGNALVCCKLPKLPAGHVYDEYVGNSGDHSKVFTSIASDTNNTTEYISDSPSTIKHSQNRPKNLKADDDSQEDNPWATFEASHSIPLVIPESGNISDSRQLSKNDDLLKMESVQLVGQACGVPSALLMLGSDEQNIKKSAIKGEENTDVSQNCASSKTEDDRLSEEEIDIDQAGSQGSTEHIQHDHSIPEGGKDCCDFSTKSKFSGSTSGDNANNNSSSKKEIDDTNSEGKEDFGDFSSQEVAPTSCTNDIDDDFGDFASQPVSSLPSHNTNSHGALCKQSESACSEDDFGSFSGKSVTADDDFGDFSGQAGTVSSASDFGWANFSSSSVSAEEDDFGDFSDTKPAVVQQSSVDHDASWTGDKIQQSKFERTLSNCFPGRSSSSPVLCEVSAPNYETDKEDELASDPSNGKDKLGVLETVLKYGVHYHSVSQQTLQVVQHPSKKDSCVKLWSHLQDVDGSPAVGYQWSKSVTNSHMFHTLRIDTQNMLIGHKKPSVPVFTTGLSLLEPIRGGSRERMVAAGDKSALVSTSLAAGMHSHTLTDPSQQDTQKTSQNIPAVYFDWSSSGLTNPLTSNSLDLDFLGVQDSPDSDKPSVLDSKLPNAPRASIRSSSQFLVDILKKVKLTRVFSRHDSGSTLCLSPEAVEVLAGFPDLSFMQSKVLMFPV